MLLFTKLHICKSAPISHRVHVQSVHTQVKGSQIHGFKHLLQGLAPPILYVNNLLWVFLHGSLDESQQVLLVHAGGCMYVCVYLESGQTTTTAQKSYLTQC